jgi:hypothetical protein
VELLVRALLPFSLLGTLLFNLSARRPAAVLGSALESLASAAVPPASATADPGPAAEVDTPLAEPAIRRVSLVLNAPDDEGLPEVLAVEPGARIPAARQPGQAPSPAVDLSELHCRTPRSLMLHSAFGAQRMAQLADAIQSRGLQTTTYREVLQALQRGQCPSDEAIIVSIDDLSTRWLRPDFREMIQVFLDRGMVLVLAVVVQGPQDPALWEEYRRLESLGMEVASHTLDHLALSAVSAEELSRQVSGSYQQLCAQLERCPVSLVLPFGAIDEHGRVLAAAAEYTFVVGIQGGRSLDAQFPTYLGRIPPDNDDQGRTLELLQRSFQR